MVVTVESDYWRLKSKYILTKNTDYASKQQCCRRKLAAEPRILVFF